MKSSVNWNYKHMNPIFLQSFWFQKETFFIRRYTDTREWNNLEKFMNLKFFFHDSFIQAYLSYNIIGTKSTYGHCISD
jgi:hypothetical protein